MRPKQSNLFVMLIIILVMVLFVSKYFEGAAVKTQVLDVTTLNQYITEGKIKDITLQDNVFRGTLTDNTQFTSNTTSEMAVGTTQLAASKNIKVAIEQPAQEPIWISLLGPLVMLIIIMGLMYFLFSGMQGGNNKAMSFGKSKATLVKQDPKKRITFADVAGLKEEKEELYEIVDFLKNPQKYANLGARIPKGILMVGLPGTGKTYLSRAIAGEAGVPFYSISGSDFVEMFVGVGASRVRDLFATAKKEAPCIIFIDEIDAVGRRRGAGLGGGNDEREQTLNQLLVEMDGFGDHEGIIIIAATNRPDILDPALLRPGRFDREITVGVPDVKERAEMLRVHARNKPLANDVDVEVLAKRTPGFTPADLENIMNEAALLAARRGMSQVTMDVIEEAITKVIAGVEKKSKIVTPKEKRLVSVHEAGHAVVADSIPGTNPVHLVTIIPRGRAGGFTMQLPDEDRNYMTKHDMESELAILLGGRAAEKLILGEISSGASNDLKRVGSLAKNMVVKYAMSENLPQMAFSEEENVFIANDMMARQDHSDQVAAEIDREIQGFVDKAYEKALMIIESKKDKLEELARALVEYETLDDKAFRLVMDQGFDALRSTNEVSATA